VGEKISTHTN
jgi:hypothetical protein